MVTTFQRNSVVSSDTALATRPRGAVLIGLGGALILTIFLSISIGSYPIPFWNILEVFANSLGLSKAADPQIYTTVLFAVRIPRVLLAVFIGAGLGITGATMQGLFRNPLVEPALIGVSAGAALAAVVVIVLVPTTVITLLPANYYLPVAAFLGGLLVTMAVYKVSKSTSQTDISTLILAGVAFNALAGALIGLVIYHAEDVALRKFTFWTLGDLGGATPSSLIWAALGVLIPSFFLLRFHKSLNALALGENEAWHLGISVERTKYIMILLTALIVGTAVALAGMIGFVGLVVPHILRLAFGPDNRLILPASMLSGAILLCFADLISRTMLSPTELPIGIITALMGSPFFIWLLMHHKKRKTI